MAFPLGRLVRYAVVDETAAAQHGQGEVWRARDQLFGEDVAIKLIRTSLRFDASALASFSREAVAGARLGRLSTNIVPVVDYGIVLDTPYFVMRWVPGRTIDHSAGSITLRAALSIAVQAARALQVAHENGIVHSDVAPMNIILTSDGTAYLSDFGYLKIVDTLLVSQGQDSLMVGGRLSYMPPEVVYAPERINAATDVYALALTLFELISGELPPRDSSGTYIIPGVVWIRREEKPAPVSLRLLLVEYIEQHKDDHRIDQFLSDLRKV